MRSRAAWIYPLHCHMTIMIAAVAHEELPLLPDQAPSRPTHPNTYLTSHSRAPSPAFNLLTKQPPFRLKNSAAAAAFSAQHSSHPTMRTRCCKPGPTPNLPPPFLPSFLLLISLRFYNQSHARRCSTDIQQWPPPSEDDGSGLLMYTQHFERSSASASGRVLCRCENVFRRLPVLAQVADGRIARAVSQVFAPPHPIAHNVTIGPRSSWANLRSCSRTKSTTKTPTEAWATRRIATDQALQHWVRAIDSCVHMHVVS